METGGLDVEREALVDMSAGDVLTFVESQHSLRVQAERNILKAAYQWAVLHNPDSLPACDKRGRDRAKPAGADGTPRITEYAAAAFGARIQTSPYGARKLIADAVDLHHRLPNLRAGIDTGTVRVRHARHVAEATRDLTPEEAAWVDAEVAGSADGRLAWKRFEALVEGKVAAACPELARAREEAAAREASVRKPNRLASSVSGSAPIEANRAISVSSASKSSALSESHTDAWANLSTHCRAGFTKKLS